MNDQEVNVRHWRLTNTQGNHYKFYDVYLCDDGTLALNWGRIGSNGQGSIERFETYPDAEHAALRQVYAKLSKGYKTELSDFIFTTTRKIILGARGARMVRPLAQAKQAWLSKNSGQFAGAAKAALNHYDNFISRAQRLMDTAKERDFEDVTKELDDLRSAWTELDEKHATANTVLGLTNQIVAQRLMGTF